MGEVARLLFVDVETTGLFGDDRVVSLGAVFLDLSTVHRPDWHLEAHHLVFNPGRKNHPRAAAVHGWSDWALSHQDPFALHADALGALFARADRLVAHNMGFDWRFLHNEFFRAGHPAPTAPRFCTMQPWRHCHGSPAGLDHAAGRLALRRNTDKHGALEDAWLAMCIYLWLHGLPQPAEPMPFIAPTNRRAVPSLPDQLPMRGRRRLAAAGA